MWRESSRKVSRFGLENECPHLRSHRDTSTLDTERFILRFMRMKQLAQLLKDKRKRRGRGEKERTCPMCTPDFH